MIRRCYSAPAHGGCWRERLQQAARERGLRRSMRRRRYARQWRSQPQCERSERCLQTHKRLAWRRTYAIALSAMAQRVRASPRTLQIHSATLRHVTARRSVRHSGVRAPGRCECYQWRTLYAQYTLHVCCHCFVLMLLAMRYVIDDCRCCRAVFRHAAEPDTPCLRFMAPCHATSPMFRFTLRCERQRMRAHLLAASAAPSAPYAYARCRCLCAISGCLLRAARHAQRYVVAARARARSMLQRAAYAAQRWESARHARRYMRRRGASAERLRDSIIARKIC